MTVSSIERRKATAAQWTTWNPTLADYEVGVESDTGRMKIGNGVTPWASLFYLIPIDLTGIADGNAIVYDATNAKFKTAAVSGGGGSVGSWESVTVTFTTPNIGESVGPNIAIPTTRPSTAQWSRTIVAGDLPTCNRNDIGFVSGLQLWASANITASIGTVNFEVSLNGSAVLSINTSSGTSGQRVNATGYAPDIKAGDVVEIRMWATSAGATIDYIGWRALPSRIGKMMPATGGRWLWRKIVANGNSPQPSATNVPSAPAWQFTRQSYAKKQNTDSDTQTSTDYADVTPNGNIAMPSAAMGQFVSRLDNLNTAQGPFQNISLAGSNQPSMNWVHIPTSYTLERLSIPSPLT